MPSRYHLLDSSANRHLDRTKTSRRGYELAPSGTDHAGCLRLLLGRNRKALDSREARRLDAQDETARFSPPFRFPPRDELPDGTTAATALALNHLGEYRGKQLLLLDLTRNPGTRTTKTFGSLAIVLRAVEHTRVTGEPVMLVAPSAANKASALRDAVSHAYKVGLATPSTLRVSVVIPASGLPKVWTSALDDDARLRQLNPICVYGEEDREGVKRLVQIWLGERLVERLALVGVQAEPGARQVLYGMLAGPGRPGGTG